MMGSFMFVAESRNLLSLLEVKHSPFDISSSIPEQQFITKNNMLLTFFLPHWVGTGENVAPIPIEEAIKEELKVFKGDINNYGALVLKLMKETF